LRRYTLNFTQPVLSTNTALVAKYVQAQLGGTVSSYQKIEGGELLMPGHTQKQQIPSNLYIRS
jgi:hypothetical protein